MYLEFAEKVVQHRTNLASNSKEKISNFLKIARSVIYCRYGGIIENKFLMPLPNRLHRNIRKQVFPETKRISREFIEFDSIATIREVVDSIPIFLDKLRHPQNPNLYRLTLSGDLQKEPSLASSVFAAKIHTMIGSKFDFQELVSHITSFQIADGTIFDPWIHKKIFF